MGLSYSLYAIAKPYNLTYFIRLFAIATFRDPFFVNSHAKPYKMFYIGSFIRLNMMKGIT